MMYTESDLKRMLSNPHISINEQHVAGAGAISRQPVKPERKAAPVRSAAATMPVATEQQEQESFFQYVDTVIVPRWPEAAAGFATMNGLHTTPALAGKARAAGNKKGVPDICFPIPKDPYHGLFIELKRVRGSKTYDEQLWYRDFLRGQGYRSEICYGWQEAAQVLTEYLSGAPAYFDNVPF